MQKLKAIPVVMLLLALLSVPSQGESKLIKMASTDWPPYTGANLPGQGFIIAIATETFAKAGYTLQVDFSAWQRSLATAMDETDYVGTLSVYYSKEREKSCYYSPPLSSSMLGFVEHKDAPIIWNTLVDLKGFRIGTVSGYLNTVEFDRMAEEQILDVSAVYNDTLNMRRVAFGRIDLAVVDKLTMQHLLATDNKLDPYRDLLQFNAKLLAQSELFLCFRKNEQGKKLQAIFKQYFDPDLAIQIRKNILIKLGLD